MRALVRDVVDTRRNIGVLLLPLAVLLVAAQIVGSREVVRLATTIWAAGLIAMVVDIVLLALRVRKALAAAHPQAGRTGRHIGYALLRSTVFRRFRMPPPRLSPGDPLPWAAPPVRPPAP